jgi:hypothetical protein
MRNFRAHVTQVMLTGAHFSAFAYLKQLFSIISCFEDQTHKHKGILDKFLLKIQSVFNRIRNVTQQRDSVQNTRFYGVFNDSFNL